MESWLIGPLSVFLLVAFCVPSGLAKAAEQQANLASQIRSDHPRLFINRDNWLAVRDRALGPANAWYEEYKREVDRLIAGNDQHRSNDRGVFAAKAAFCYLMSEDGKYLQAAGMALAASVAFYEECYEQRKAVDWYGLSRTHWLMAWDWLYNDLPAADRDELIARYVNVLDNVLKANIYRENKSGPRTGYYGVSNCMWYTGVAALGANVAQQRTIEWLNRGYADHMELLAYRREMAGDDGSPIAGTVGYSLGAYPDTEFNFYYTLASATGRQIAADWPHSAMLAEFILWNWIVGPDGYALEYGYGDTPHTTNALPVGMLYAHTTNLRHFYAESAPELAGAAHAVQKRVEKLPGKHLLRYRWFIHPFCQSGLEDSPPPMELSGLPPAKYFKGTGQVFMRSGTGPDATYALFSVGGDSPNHRHYDSLHFTIYKGGFQAMDTGTRWSQFANARHLANYFAQTVAHNCVLVHMPDERPAKYWGMPPGEKMTAPNYGGQDIRTRSTLEALETNDVFTYVAGDASKCYSPGKCKLATRQMVFVMPDIFVIFDRVISTEPEYRKDWVLHTGAKPTIDGRVIASEGGDGKLFCRSLLPEAVDIRAVGGEGNEFRTGDKNWDIETVAGRRRLSPDNLAMIGQWRVEISPHEPAGEDLFLQVIQVGPKTLGNMIDTELIRGDDSAGVRFEANGRKFEISFTTQGRLAGHIKADGDRPLDRPLVDKITPQAEISGR